jgi:hypothetical protein
VFDVLDRHPGMGQAVQDLLDRVGQMDILFKPVVRNEHGLSVGDKILMKIENFEEV